VSAPLQQPAAASLEQPAAACSPSIIHPAARPAACGNISLEKDHGVERRAAQRAARWPLLPPRADGLDDAPPAAAGVAARVQLAVERARQAHRAHVAAVSVARAAVAIIMGVVAPIMPV
jgi:hypothetical protein